MPRKSRHSPIDLTVPHELTVGLIQRLNCPADAFQAFLRDSKSPSLRVRVTASGAKSFVFESKLNRQTIRRTIGSVAAWSIDLARAEANRLRVTLDTGIDPREQSRQQIAGQAAKRQLEKVDSITVREVWDLYIAARKPYWGERHYKDHISLCKDGGIPRTNHPTLTSTAGALNHFMGMKLKDVSPAIVEAWAEKEGQIRPTVAQLGWRCLKAFLNWCAEQPPYAAISPIKNAAKTQKTKEALGKVKVKNDALMKEQLPAWFDAVGKLTNPTVAAYLKTVLLTGARPGEILVMKWEDINWQWNGITIRDKVEGVRVIPFTPYVRSLLEQLPRRNQWVFSSPRPDRPHEHMSRLDPMHSAACKVACIDNLTLNGLRRSFRSLSEWLEIPTGVVAQIMGHKPSATAEKHYTVRPLDLLRVHHEKIEAWILEQAGVMFDAKAALIALRVVRTG